MQLNINTDAAVVFTNKLEKLHKYDLPVVINRTLNDAAFDVKKNTLLKTAESTFKTRSKSFFKATSHVEMSKGFDISKMKATVGFRGGEKNQAVRDLEKQEEGGNIGGRSFIPIDSARVGGKDLGLVKKQNRYSTIDKKRIIDARKVVANSKKQRFIKAVFIASKVDGFVLGNHVGKKGFRTLSKINSLSSNVKSKKLEIKRTALFSVKGKNTVKIDSTNFMKRASHESGLKIENFFIANAKKRMNLK